MKKAIFLTIGLAFTILGFAQTQRIIEGKVTNSSNMPITGVIVESDHSTTGLRTDINGQFKLLIDSLAHKLIFSFPGMKTVEKEIEDVDFYRIILNEEEKKTENVISGSPVISQKMSLTGTYKSTQHAMISIHPMEDFNTEDYSTIHESGFRNVLNEPLSTFSIDVDRASYSNIRRFLNMGQLPPVDAVKIEEMVNYFQYNYPEPEGNKPFEMITEFSDCPWNTKHQLILVGLQSKKMDTKDLPPSNLVFLIDVSGSMQAPNKLPLVQSSLKMLTNNLRPQDKVAIVVYAGSAGLVLESTFGSNKQKIIETIDQLKAGGSTAGGEGLTLAYKVASENFMSEGNNRIIIATDGDFNVGQSSDAEMERLVIQQRNHGIYLSVLGYGMGNLKDNKLETIADNGNGNYAYIDNSQEAYKILIEEFGSTLYTLAKDVKIQIEFNPSQVKAYRLIGYENRALKNEDFNNDKKDAGELGSGHQVTALYEIIPSSSDEDISLVDHLKYQKTVQSNKIFDTNEVMTLKVRFKEPDSATSQSITEVMNAPCLEFKSASNNIKLAAAIVQFGMLLRNSEYKGSSEISNVLSIVESINTDNLEEFIQLIKVADSLGLVYQKD